jgi:CheY-like chemotaxis protein
VVQRVCQRQREREHEAAASAQQRAVIEDLLKDLIRTERRAIDAEDALATSARPAAASAGPEPRAPAVLVVEHDRRVADDLADLLESAGVATFAYVSGEEALRAATALAANGGLDLAVVAARLPGMDGVETVRQLRERFADLPAFLMTSPEDDAAAAAAAALGVAGYVEKPLADVGAVVERLAELARESASRTRESQYVQRIKERHERVLEKYRSLPRLP